MNETSLPEMTLLEKINVKYKKILADNLEVLIGDTLAIVFGYSMYSPMQNKYMIETKEFLNEPITTHEIKQYIFNKELIDNVNVTNEILKEYTDEIMDKLNKPFEPTDTVGYIDVLLLSIIIRNNRIKRIINSIPSVPAIKHPPRPIN
jgi:hypothetical protein